MLQPGQILFHPASAFFILMLASLMVSFLKGDSILRFL
jgi:hypothetical protein